MTLKNGPFIAFLTLYLEFYIILPSVVPKTAIC